MLKLTKGVEVNEELDEVLVDERLERQRLEKLRTLRLPRGAGNV